MVGIFKGISYEGLGGVIALRVVALDFGGGACAISASPGPHLGAMRNTAIRACLLFAKLNTEEQFPVCPSPSYRFLISGSGPGETRKLHSISAVTLAVQHHQGAVPFFPAAEPAGAGASDFVALPRLEWIRTKALDRCFLYRSLLASSTHRDSLFLPRKSLKDQSHEIPCR